MKCILIFDYLNDIVYTKYNRKFLKHINKFARSQGLLSEDQENESDKLLANIIMQIFSPIITSQKIMTSQFGNSYTTCQCQDGSNIVFEQYMGHVFVSISQDDVIEIKRLLGVCVSFVRHLCGADVSLLQSNKSISNILTRLLDTWIWLHANDQAVLVEAVEQLMVNTELSSATLRALQEAIEKLKTHTEYAKVHAMVLVQNKFLSLYSSRNAQDLSAADIMFINMLCLATRNEYKPEIETEDSEDMSEEFFSPSSSPQLHTSDNFENPDESISFQVMLMGTDASPKSLPHVVHINALTECVNLVILIEIGATIVSSGLYESFLYLTHVQTIQAQRDIDTLRPAFENLDMAIKKTNDGLRKNKSSAVEVCHKKMVSKWDFIRKKYQEFVKTGDCDCLLRAESSLMSLLDILKELFMITCMDTTLLNSSTEKVGDIARFVGQRLMNFSDFLKVKALRNLSLGSASLTINKYLEEFPGLVHFLYIDRTNHRITAPSLDFNSEETVTLTKKKIWTMVKFSRSHLQQGHLSMMWKDTTFNYAYFLWFEDRAGSPLKPKIFPTNASKALPQPGILCGDFYQKLIEVCFPKMSTNKVRCYELFCIHLGLVTSSCVLEHTRRLAATIWEVIGVPNNPIDLL